MVTYMVSSIWVYYMQATQILIKILCDLDKICNKFLWGEENGKKQLHLVNRETTFLQKDSGAWGERSSHNEH